MAQAFQPGMLAGSIANGHMAWVAYSIIEGEFMSVSVPSLGELPEWDLRDLYESGQSEAFTDDLRRAREEASRFSQKYEGKLDALTRDARGGELLAQAIRDYEGLDDLLGRWALMPSYFMWKTQPIRRAASSSATRASNSMRSLQGFYFSNLSSIGLTKR